MTIKIGINGFGRMGRLTMRAAYDWEGIEIVQINDPAGNAETLAHLMTFDSVHGRWHHEATHLDNNMIINGNVISCTQNTAIEDTHWSNCDVVIEASGKMKTHALLQAYLNQGVKRVVVTAPIPVNQESDHNILNVVMGVNDELFNPEIHPIVTAASCTTNCIAPVVKVIHENIGIKHGSITTIHDITNTQTIIDAPHKDLRRARSCGTSLIPTTTGSAKAITDIFPELKGRLNGHAIRVPLTNASITDCVFEVEKSTSVEEVNQLLSDAAANELNGILGFETRPLVSVDYKTDPRSAIIDAPSTMVVNNTQVKLYVWYDNEWGYANRTAELVRKVGLADLMPS
mgnify:FL=1